MAKLIGYRPGLMPHGYHQDVLSYRVVSKRRARTLIKRGEYVRAKYNGYKWTWEWNVYVPL